SQRPRGSVSGWQPVSAAQVSSGRTLPVGSAAASDQASASPLAPEDGSEGSKKAPAPAVCRRRGEPAAGCSMSQTGRSRIKDGKRGERKARCRAPRTKSSDPANQAARHARQLNEQDEGTRDWASHCNSFRVHRYFATCSRGPLRRGFFTKPTRLLYQLYNK